MNSTIALLDPSLENHNGTLSNNLGDVIIYESVSKIIKEIFPKDEVIRISTHEFLEAKHYKVLKNSKYAFIGGSNILSSDLRTYNQWKVSNSKWYYYFPGLSNIVLLGVGWWQYQNNPTFSTKRFYNSVLSKKISHSVRDKYTFDKMQVMGINNTLNTGCITSWNLNKLNVNKKHPNNKRCIFTLTDYNPSPELDNKLIDLLLSNYTEGLYFFPQGKNDEQYIRSLSTYKRNMSSITIVNRTIRALDDLLSKDIDYVGTRLHGGIKCLQNSMDSLIVAVDNRAIEISKDTNLPVVQRNDFKSMSSWMNGKDVFEDINLPTESITKWKNQFST